VTKRRVLVTGASGFIGRVMVERLLEAGYEVRAATRDGRSFPGSVDIADIGVAIDTVDWKPILAGVDFVIHLVGLVHVANRFGIPVTFDSINRQTTKNLACAAKEAGVARFVFISSVRAQVGSSADRPVRETDIPRPTNDYGRSKLAAEDEVRASGVPFTILRPVAVYGPHSKGNIKTLAKLALTPLPLPVPAFRGRRSLLGIDNFISAILFVLTNPATANETYLIADATPFTVSEIFTMLRKALGRRPGLVHVPASFLRLALKAANRLNYWPRLGEDLIVDTAKLQALGWRPAVGTYEGIAAMMRAEHVVTARSK
jgi:nucleoside-diphosphate-sugar epimerase